jgi:hypothetical protein
LDGPSAVLVMLVVQLHVQLGHADTPEYVLCVADDVLGVGIGQHLQLEATAVVVGAQCPEVLLVDSLHSLQLHNSLVAVSQLVVELLGTPLHEDGHAVGQQMPHRDCDQHRDEDATDGVGNEPSKSPHEDSGDDHASTAQGVREDVQEHTLHDLTPLLSLPSVAVTAVMAVPVISSSMTVAVRSAMLEHEDTDQVHKESQNGDDQETFMFHFRRLHKSLHSLGEDEERYEEQEESVDEASESFGSDVAVAVVCVSSPLCYHRGHESSHQTGAVKKHVEAIGDESEGVSPDAVEELNESEGEIEKEEAEQVPGVWVCEDETNPGGLQEE